jgi:protein-disulfide isomerase
MSDEQKKFEITPSIAIVIAGICIAGAILYTSSRSESPKDGLPASVNVPAPAENEHIFGSPGASVFLIEYSDFECPFCAMVHPTLKRLVNESEGRVAWIYRHLPLDIHPQAFKAAVASECAGELLGNSGFWAFADALFANQKSLGISFYTDAAVSLGADRSAYSACLISGKFDSKIEKSLNDALQNGGGGTPFTVVYGNGAQAPISGALPYDNFKSVIDAIINRQ